MRDRLAVDVDDRRIRELLGVCARLENRPQAIVVAERGDGVLAAADDRLGAMEDRVGKQFAVGLALFEADAGELGEVVRTQDDDSETDDDGDAGDLFSLDAATQFLCPLPPAGAVCCAAS